jgi:signal transduction histidine kinase
VNGKDILIVEDETIVALDMKMRLQSLGYGVLGVVDTGDAAIKFVEGVTPDLILMDIRIKGSTDGIETAQKIREKVEVPVIFVTAYTDEATLGRAKLVSPYGYIVKPFHERELRIGIELALYKFQYELSMRRSKELAEEANIMKSQFLANVSHELKTPLNSVIGFTELSLDCAVSEDQREFLATVLRSAQSLVTLIDSILDFARLESDRLVPVFSPFPLDELLDQCVEFLAVGAKSKELGVSFRRDRKLPAIVVGDRGRMMQILMNLIDNALKFTEKGSIRLRAEVAESDALGPSSTSGQPPAGSPGNPEAGRIVLRFVVEDTGIGIAEDKIPRIFERFTQLDGSSTRMAGGTGLGLAIVAKSLEVLGGKISVASQEESGSSFEVLVPFGLAASPSPSMAAKAAKLPLAGHEVGIVGFSEESTADLEELLLGMGASSLRGRNLVDPCLASCRYVIVGEGEALASYAAAQDLRGRLIVAAGPGFSARTELSNGCIISSHPMRAKPLLAAIAALDKQGWPQKYQGLGGRRAVSCENPVPAEGIQFDSASLSEAGKREFVSLVDALEAATRMEDFVAAERKAKESREFFLGIEADVLERLAFSALLLARKSDGKGLEEILRRARLIEEQGAMLDQN